VKDDFAKNALLLPKSEIEEVKLIIDTANAKVPNTSTGNKRARSTARMNKITRPIQLVTVRQVIEDILR